MIDFVEVAGWVGVTLILFGYFLITTGKASGGSLTYQLINLFGALGAGINAFQHRSYPVAALNTVWLGIAIIAVMSIMGGRMKGVSKNT